MMCPPPIQALRRRNSSQEAPNATPLHNLSSLRSDLRLVIVANFTKSYCAGMASHLRPVDVQRFSGRQ
jgi:hypothetical protein